MKLKLKRPESAADEDRVRAVLNEQKTWTVKHSTCLKALSQMPDESVDAVVTDPPYGLSFMGKKWDYDVPSVEIWREVLRVLKPGGHLLSFGGTRTYHRMVVNIEDAGFEVRDMIVWHYGSGFPKSLDVGKQMDKRGGQAVAWFGPWLTRWREANGISRKAVAALFPSRQKYAGKEASGKLTGCVGNWETGISLPTPEQFNLICTTFGLPFASLEEAERAVIKERTMIQGGGTALELRVGERREVKADVTAPASDPAKRWAGWGTALKPASEPIVVARKPLIGTVAENVLKHGTGAINVDGCRIGTNEIAPKDSVRKEHDEFGTFVERGGSARSVGDGAVHLSGRWPANVIFSHAEGCRQVGTKREGKETMEAWECVDGCPVAELDRQSGVLKSGQLLPHHKRGEQVNTYGKSNGAPPSRAFGGDAGGASRFFYCAKASRSEREKGLLGKPLKQGGALTDRKEGSVGLNSPRAGAGRLSSGRANIHPTVKPLSLMRYLVRLVTPPKGVVLDPYTGSGTTGCAAVLERFRFIGIEREEEYTKIARARIKHWKVKR